MNSIRSEVRDLIALNEKIQGAFLRGERMTDSEKQIIRLCSTDLLASIARMEEFKPEMKWRDGDAMKRPDGLT